MNSLKSAGSEEGAVMDSPGMMIGPWGGVGPFGEIVAVRPPEILVPRFAETFMIIGRSLEYLGLHSQEIDGFPFGH